MLQGRHSNSDFWKTFSLILILSEILMHKQNKLNEMGVCPDTVTPVVNITVKKSMGCT